MKPILSIAIPTYNRARFLKECLDSITVQFKERQIKNQVEIIISDNASPDNTREVVKIYQRKFNNIRYLRNKKNFGPVYNLCHVASKAHSKYIWLFADDDQQEKSALKTVLTTVNRYKPDTLFCNIALYSKDLKKQLEDNLLTVDRDFFLKNKKELFSFLETKFFLAIDWYTTFLSDIILSREVVKKNTSAIKRLDETKFRFPHTAYIFYNTYDYTTYVISKTLAKYRTENIPFSDIGTKNFPDFLGFLYRILRNHDYQIYKINKKNISWKFTFLLVIKHFSRAIRLLFMRLFNYDISRILIRLYYGKYPLEFSYTKGK